MELALWIVVGALVLWNFYLHGKVKEKSIAAKAQQIIRDWQLSRRKTWEAEFNGGQSIESCHIVSAVQTDFGKWTTWTCSCGQVTKGFTSEMKRKYRQHKNIMKMVAK